MNMSSSYHERRGGEVEADHKLWLDGHLVLSSADEEDVRTAMQVVRRIATLISSGYGEENEPPVKVSPRQAKEPQAAVMHVVSPDVISVMEDMLDYVGKIDPFDALKARGVPQDVIERLRERQVDWRKTLDVAKAGNRMVELEMRGELSSRDNWSPTLAMALLKEMRDVFFARAHASFPDEDHREFCDGMTAQCDVVLKRMVNREAGIAIARRSLVDVVKELKNNYSDVPKETLAKVCLNILKLMRE